MIENPPLLEAYWIDIVVHTPHGNSKTAPDLFFLAPERGATIQTTSIYPNNCCHGRSYEHYRRT